jgi:hypothetical protein
MKVYIASCFADKDRVAARCKELNAIGIETTSRWALEGVPHNCKITDPTGEYLVETAVADIHDIVIADKLVLTVPTPAECMNLTPHQMSRGGRHFESGLMYGLLLSEWSRMVENGTDVFLKMCPSADRKELIVMGEKENVFHFLNGTGSALRLPTVTVLPNWDEVKAYLAAQLTK